MKSKKVAVPEQKKKKGKELTGKVVSVKAKDTVVIKTERFHLHPLYKKPMRRTRRLAVHAPGHKVKIGDIVTAKETKPISKTKHFILVNS